MYLARWGHREVALKVLRDGGVGGSERARFLDEAARLAALAHPGVIKVFGSGELPDGRPYLAMERLSGEPLAARLQRGPLPLERALALFGELADAVEAMHRSQLLHRDLKPENIMLVEGDQHAVLLDFGIAKELDAPASTVTQEGGVRGTPAYMAPERFFGAAAGVATDVYELAVVLFAMLSGTLPWDEVADPAGRLAPRRLSERGVSVPPALEAALARALSTRPEMRPGSAAELAAAVCAGPEGDAGRRTLDLRGGRSSAPPPVAEVAAANPPSRRSRRRALGWVAAAAVVVAAAVAGAIAWGGGEAAKGAEERVAASAGAEPAASDAAAAPVFVPREGDDSGLAAATRVLPGATDFYLALRARELRQSAAFADVITRLQGSRELAPVRALAALCGVDPIDDLDWIAMTGVVGGGTGEGEVQVDVLAAGAWTRAEIDGCIGLMGTARADEGFTELRAEGQTRWLAWLDDRTLLVSSRPEADRAWLEARIAGAGGLDRTAGPIADLLGELDPGATLIVASRADDALGELWPGLPAPPVTGAELRVGADLDGRLLLRYGDAATAESAATGVRKSIDEFLADPVARMYAGELEVAVEGGDVAITAHLDQAMTALTAQAVAAAIESR